jgi:hypothetical protein
VRWPALVVASPTSTAPMMRLSASALRLRLAASLALSLLCLVRPAYAQDARTGRLEGRVIDSTRARPLTGTRVVAVGLDAPATASGAASTDSAGKYHIDSLPPGRYAVGFESRLLDSLEINVSPRETVVAPAQTATIDLALPPAAKLRSVLCPGITLPPQTGVIFGHVVDAESENPISDVVVALSWQERDVDRFTLKPVNRERIASASTDANGWYRLCGVPTDTWLSLQLQQMDRTGPVIRTLVDDTLGIAVRHLSFTPSTLRPAPDSVQLVAASGSARDSIAASPLTGTAMLSGIVRGTGDTPLSSAEVRVRDASATSTTDGLGRYTLRGLPAGTQVLEVRHVGYGAAELPVELRSGVMTTSDVRLQRIVNLDSIRVVASRTRYKEFNEFEKKKIFGVFLGPEEMQWRSRVAYASDVIQLIPGYKIVGEGKNSQVMNGRGYQAFPCKTNIVVDGLENVPINDIPPAAIGVIAAYRLGDQGPPEYDHGCGAIIIWTKR